MHNPVNNKRIKIELQDNPVHVQEPCCNLHRMILEHEQDCPAMFQDNPALKKRTWAPQIQGPQPAPVPGAALHVTLQCTLGHVWIQILFLSVCAQVQNT